MLKTSKDRLTQTLRKINEMSKPKTTQNIDICIKAKPVFDEINFEKEGQFPKAFMVF
jgi:hypothetical protein